MSRIRTLGVAALVMTLALAASTVWAAKKADNAIHGKVTAITKTTDNTGSFVVAVHAKKSKTADAAATAEEKTFKVDAKTTFMKVMHKKGEAATEEAATFADLKKGDEVAVESTDGVTATSVKFHAGRKAKKPAA